MASKSYQMFVERMTNDDYFPELWVEGPYSTWTEVYNTAKDLVDREQARYIEIVGWTTGKVLAQLGTPWNESSKKPDQ